MFNVFKIVNWLRVKSNEELRLNETDEELTQMKAMKLLYYIQGVSLVYLKKPMFNEEIVAWQYGPVVKEVHDKYAGQKGIVGEITDQDIHDYQELSANEAVNDVLNSVWDQYGDLSAIQLMKKTHNEMPWKKTDLNEVITHQKLIDYFKTIVETD